MSYSNGGSNWYVYKHTNKTNGKCYIGITSQNPPEKRWKNGNGYYNHHRFFCAIKSYGWEGFEHEILFSNLTQEEACAKEKELIMLFDSKNNGYNETDGGEGLCGYVYTQEDREKVSAGVKRFLQNNPDELEKRKNFLKQWKIQNPEKEQQRIDKTIQMLKSEAFIKNRSEKLSKKVKCLETGEIFNSRKEAALWAGISDTGIIKVLHGVQKTAGKHPETGQKLHWEEV